MSDADPPLPPQLNPDWIAARVRKVAPLVERIKALLACQGPELQGMVLADLLAIWLAGHQVAGDTKATRVLRADLLAMHLTAVRHLVEINAHIIGTQPSLDG